MDEQAAAVATWRAARDVRLRSPDGWLALVGLHWLVQGENHVGAHPANQVVLHGHEIPPRVGSLWVDGDRVRLVPHAGVEVLHAGKPVGEVVLEDDRNEHPTVLELGTLRFHLIRRGDRLGVRVRDTSAPALARFKGLDSFPIDPAWRVTARLGAATPGASVETIDITGEPTRIPCAGVLSWQQGGATWHLDAVHGDEDGSLWLIFGDATNGTDTYGGGRYLYTDPPLPDGSVTVDFNLAYNMPCAFSAYATCPLPPPQNRLPIRVEAGERIYRAP